MNSLIDALPGAMQVSSLPPYRLEVELRNGQTMFLDLEALIRQRDAYWRLRQLQYLSMVSLEPLGGICWPECEDLAPDGLDWYVVSRR